VSATSAAVSANLTIGTTHFFMGTSAGAEAARPVQSGVSRTTATVSGLGPLLALLVLRRRVIRDQNTA
jgi:hypothetical protein